MAGSVYCPPPLASAGGALQPPAGAGRPAPAARGLASPRGPPLPPCGVPLGSLLGHRSLRWPVARLLYSPPLHHSETSRWVDRPPPCDVVAPPLAAGESTPVSSLDQPESRSPPFLTPKLLRRINRHPPGDVVVPSPCRLAGLPKTNRWINQPPHRIRGLPPPSGGPPAGWHTAAPPPPVATLAAPAATTLSMVSCSRLAR